MEQHQQIEELKQAMKQTHKTHMYKRYQAVMLYLTGDYKQEEVAKIVGVTPKTVGTHVASYRNGGLSALTPKSSGGRKPRLSKEQEEELVRIITTSLPCEVGFKNMANWKLSLIVKLTERQWGVTYSIRGMSQMMERLGLSYTRPTYTLAKADPEKQKKFVEETFPALKKTDQ